MEEVRGVSGAAGMPTRAAASNRSRYDITCHREIATHIRIARPIPRAGDMPNRFPIFSKLLRPRGHGGRKCRNLFLNSPNGEGPEAIPVRPETRSALPFFDRADIVVTIRLEPAARTPDRTRLAHRRRPVVRDEPGLRRRVGFRAIERDHRCVLAPSRQDRRRLRGKRVDRHGHDARFTFERRMRGHELTRNPVHRIIPRKAAPIHPDGDVLPQFEVQMRAVLTVVEKDIWSACPSGSAIQRQFTAATVSLDKLQTL